MLFDKVSTQMPVNYRELTKAAGTANLLISDRVEKPFDAQIIFDFCPPGKRHGVDLEMLSGGEKTVAALAFVFAMVQVVRPSILVLDEVDGVELTALEEVLDVLVARLVRQATHLDELRIGRHARDRGLAARPARLNSRMA